MKIKWLKQVELTVVYRYDIYGDIADEGLEIRKENDTDDVDIVEFKGKKADIRFAKTSFTYAVPINYFELVED